MKIVIDIPDEYYKFIKDLQFYHSGRRNGKTIERNVINAIKNGKPYEEKPQGEWIPVSESLPEECQRVLVTIVNYREDKVVRVSEYYNREGKGVFRIKENNEQWEVGEKGLLAWMPLPEPYKEAENDDS